MACLFYMSQGLNLEIPLLPAQYTPRDAVKNEIIGEFNNLTPFLLFDVQMLALVLQELKVASLNCIYIAMSALLPDIYLNGSTWNSAWHS